MLDLFPLPLFPQGSLASSVVTTVWVGVAVVAFFNLRLGWVLSGLVVPGYLVPLLIIKPWSAAVVLVEGIITYLIVWLFSERLSKLGYWFNFFGRDRFFALVLVSIAVRVGFDGWLWPAMGLWVNDTWGLAFDYRNNLQSFGLIIIALIANQFWKTGLLRGVVPLAVTVGVTYLIVRYGLMEWTNFTISNVGYMYEDIASSILASPKAYIILIVAALVASRMNLLYGWDFSGILIPSLLALQWYQPTKILASFAEALLILWIATMLLRLPVFRNANIEGARKLLLFFNIGFVYKVLLGYFMIWQFPEMKITDTYAFGYLLATLLAIKMHDKDIAARMTRATLQTSLAGIAIASLVGFMLTLLPLGPVADNRIENSAAVITDRPDVSLSQRLSEDKVRFYASYRSQVPVPLSAELEAFGLAFGLFDQLRSGNDDAVLQRVAASLNLLGFQVEKLEDRYLYISETDASRGWGVYVVNLDNPGGLLVEVPAPLDEQGTLEAGTELFRLLDAGALAVAGTRREANPDQSADVLRNPQTVYHQFHRVMASNSVLQVRAYTVQSVRELEGQRPDPDYLAGIQLPSRLWVKSTLPPELDLPKLRDHTGELEVEWGDSPFVNRQRDTVRKGFAELLLSRPALRRVHAKSVRTDIATHIEVQDQRIDGYLQEWILSGKHLTATRGSDDYVVPSVDELLYFDEEVLAPLLQLIVRAYGNSGWTEEGQAGLRNVQAAAAVIGYRLMQYRHRQSRQEFIVLHEPETGPRRYWGTYVLRLGAADPYLIQVPRPLYEVNSFEYAVSLFERLNARALLIAGAHPDANRDGSADLVRLENMHSLFSLVNQVLLRESGDTPMMAIHSRARGYRTGVAAVQEDALLSARHELPVEVGEDALSAKFLDTLQNDGVSFRFVDGSPETAGYEVDGVAQSQYLAATSNKQFWAIWLSSTARSNYRQQTENRQEVARFNALGIETIEEDLHAYLVERTPEGHASTVVSSPLREEIRRYLESQDIVNLRSLQRNWPQFDFKRLVDRDSRQSFIVVHDGEARALLVANLNPRQPAIELAWRTPSADRSTVLDFVNRRAGWLVLEQGS